MCGINGIFSSAYINDISLRIRRMNDAIKHRGPDAEGHIVLNNSFALGHRRLSIIDLDARSNQPMVSPAGNVLVYNGEIYNYKEIKEQIHDYHFQTESDTEVILATIECYGLDWLLKRANVVCLLLHTLMLRPRGFISFETGWG